MAKFVCVNDVDVLQHRDAVINDFAAAVAAAAVAVGQILRRQQHHQQWPALDVADVGVDDDCGGGTPVVADALNDAKPTAVGGVWRAIDGPLQRVN